ncbi:MAG TPA: hypothetical protein P5077_11510 [bacterium]|nr:hypothetical protein [bacterium]
MSTSRIVEVTIVVSMFLVYLGLWRLKRARDIHRTGVDPEVLARARTPVQAYFAKLVGIMTVSVVAIIGLHAFFPDAWSPLVRVSALDSWHFDLLGGCLGVAGLALCALAQMTMGSSWRVGIDINHHTDLVTDGIYR